MRQRGQGGPPRVSIHRRAAAADTVDVQRRPDTAQRHVPGTVRRIYVFTLAASRSD